MSRFNQIRNASHDPQLSVLYQDILDHGLGGDSPTNWFTAQSERPDILEATWGLFKGILLQGMLPPTVKEMISMTIAMQNNCRYCRVAHTKALEAMGVPEEVIQSCAQDPELAQLPPTQRAIVKFGLKTARSPQSLTDEDLQGLRDHGLSDGEIMEIVMVAACSNFLDTWAEVSGIPLDWEGGSS
ncbi:MAG: peroxidase-related enzyme [Acidobacteriota bacterium]